jgi:hypothetical protein
MGDVKVTQIVKVGWYLPTVSCIHDSDYFLHTTSAFTLKIEEVSSIEISQCLYSYVVQKPKGRQPFYLQPPSRKRDNF